MPPTRQYRSPRRAKDAAETRRAILAAATELFATEGYARVTVADIAKRAEVAVPTVYASTGGKADMLRTITAEAFASSGAQDTVELVRATTTLHEAVRVLAHGTRQGNEHQAVTTQILLAARLVDADAEKVWQDGIAGYRAALHEVAALLHARGQLAPSLTVAETSDILWFSVGIHAWRALVHDCGWTWDRAECWFATHLESVLTAQ
ncbi:TetR/AcrR family transcriptional regulator [Kibdelosporangium philippinense]|uniref:TetR/AcrR family transcriptional regulator n=1 Tax=Kibdelosporangium philippinense TaxID=211113 RepID=A0ABS8Z908_9PSEU|nr:TetR/AcrR family transcriptional regulator [Kibdelosporangium philippinense]MCE7002337.1 TetR/AcrR family transcriptional regulator [Kibdelosporangium philippinense]